MTTLDELERAVERLNRAVERLRAVESSHHNGITTNWHRNPDGPEAADLIERLAAMLAASPQGEGSSADPAPIKPSVDTGELRYRVAQIIGEAVNRRAPGQIVFSTLEDADAILDLIQSERGPL